MISPSKPQTAPKRLPCYRDGGQAARQDSLVKLHKPAQALVGSGREAVHCMSMTRRQPFVCIQK